MCLPKVAIIGGNPSLVQTLQQYLNQYAELLYFSKVSDSKIKHCSIAFVCHNLPANNGLENLLLLKQYHPSVLAIMLGKQTSQHDIVESFRLGAKDFLFAPIQKETLLSCLFRFKSTTESFFSIQWWKNVAARLFQKKKVTYGIVEPNIAEIIQKSSKQQPHLNVQMLGSFSVQLNGKTISKLSGKKAMSVLAYIFYNYPKMVHKDVLIDKFWGDSSATAARNCLNVTLHAIRKSFCEISDKKNILIYKNESYGIDSDLVVERDIDMFESFWSKGRRLEQEEGTAAAVNIYDQAFSFYNGEFMEELLYEEWTERARDHFKETSLVILDRLSAYFFEKEAYQQSLTLCQRMLEKDKCLEGVHRRSMSCYSKLGMKDMAIRQFQKCKEDLKKELNISPGNATIELYRKILAS